MLAKQGGYRFQAIDFVRLVDTVNDITETLNTLTADREGGEERLVCQNTDCGSCYKCFQVKPEVEDCSRQTLNNDKPAQPTSEGVEGKCNRCRMRLSECSTKRWEAPLCKIGITEYDEHVVGLSYLTTHAKSVHNAAIQECLAALPVCSANYSEWVPLRGAREAIKKLIK